MRTSLMDFTRGSQVAETIAMMFGTALRPMIYTVLAIVAAVIGWLVWTQTQTGDSYYWLMHVYASAWLWMKFNPDKLLGLKTLTQGTVMVHMTAVNTYPPLLAAWLRLWSAIIGGTFYGLLMGIPLAIGSTVALRRYGRGLTRRRHKRGSQLVALPRLITELAIYNDTVGKSDRADDKARLLAGLPWHRQVRVSRQALVAAGAYEPFCLAGVPYPWRAEQTHTMLVGTTGTGKSTLMKNLLDQIRARGGRAVVFDLTGTYIESFYNSRTDIILNPFDARCPKWSPFSDAHTREHFKEASLALVPLADGGGEQFWPESARLLFVEVCVKLVREGRGNNQALFDVLMTSKLKDLHAHVLKTVAAPLTDPEARRMAESIRATFNTYAQALGCLPTEGRSFSVRDWVLESGGATGDDGVHEPAPGSVLFIAAQHVNLRSVRVLLTLWLTTAINTLMSMPGDQRDIRLWFLLDEVNALHNIPAIVSGMQTARNFGGAFVLGVHTMHQLKETYGDNLAETVASLAKTKLMMNTRDEGTQKWASAQVGEGEWAEMEENFSYGVSNVRDAATLQKKVKLEPLVIPSQFQELCDLTGYLKFPQGMPAALIDIRYVRYAKPNRGFIERDIAPLAPPPGPPLALPHYIMADSLKVTRDGEIIDGPSDNPATAEGGSPTPGETQSDLSGEGFQTVVGGPSAPDRAPAPPGATGSIHPDDWKANHVASGRMDAALDPRLNPRILPVGTGTNTAALTMQRGRQAAAADPVKDEPLRRERDTPTAGIVVQEQRQSFGEEEKTRRHHERAKGNNVPAHHLDPSRADAERSSPDDEWGRGA